MSAPGATPGPWPVEKTGDGKRYLVGVGLVEGLRGYDVAEVYSDDCDPAEAKANAYLIAAAPDMFAALEWIFNNTATNSVHHIVARDALAKATPGATHDQ